MAAKLGLTVNEMTAEKKFIARTAGNIR